MVAIVAFDLETTGFCPLPLVSPYHRVIQIAATRIDNGTKLSFVTFVNPDMLIPPQSSKIHRITDELVIGAPSWSNAVDLMMRSLDITTGTKVIMVAHNARHFDEIIFRKECLRDPPLACLSNITFGDSLPVVRKLYPGWESYRLEDVHLKLFGVGIKEAHRADNDVDALVNIVEHIIQSHGVDVLLSQDSLEANQHVSDMRFIGVYRSIKCYETTGASTMGELRTVFQSLRCKCKVKEWLQYDIGIRDITAQLSVISQISEIPLYRCSELIRLILPGNTLTRHILRYEDCLNEVDYYIKKRYADAYSTNKNQTIYLRGLHKCYHQIKEF